MSINNTSHQGHDIPIVIGNGAMTSSLSFDTTEAQLEIWLASKQSVQANCAYNEITTLTFVGPLNPRILRNSLTEIYQRHQILNATVSADGLQMAIDPSRKIDLDERDFSELDPGRRESAIKEVVNYLASFPFDLEQGPLFRAVLQKISTNEHRLTLSAHHIVLDGWSLGVFCNDLGKIYDRQNGLPITLPPANTYHQYSRSMNEYFESDQAGIDEKFWTDKFADSTPTLELPVDLERPAQRTWLSERVDHALPADLVARLRKTGAKFGCSIFNTILAAFECYVSRISGCRDFCIGIPTAGQMAMDQPELIGQCVNTMPLRSKIDLNRRFSDHLKKTRGNLLDSLEHQRYSFGKLLSKLDFNRDPRRAPMVAVSFNLDPEIDTSEIGFTGLRVNVTVEPRMFECFEWFINGVLQQDGSIEFQVQYNSDLFSGSTMQFFMDGFHAFVEQIEKDPNQVVAMIPTMNLQQQRQMLVEWNDTEQHYPSPQTLHGLVSEQARQRPNATAIEFDSQQLTYGELDRQSSQWAAWLNSQGVQQGALVGLCVPRNLQMVVQLLGILKSGAGYVPLDPAFPQDRLKYMCDQSRLQLVLADDTTRNQADRFGIKTVVAQDIQQEIANLPNDFAAADLPGESTCYVIYTSGSTGNPKGVNVPHGAVTNFLQSMAAAPGFGQQDKVLAVTTLSFDIAVLEIYLPLVTGGTTVIASKEMTQCGKSLARGLDDHGITLFQSTPATLRLMMAAGWTGNTRLKVLCGGEPMPADLVAPLLDRCGQLWNMYGPTETTVWSSIYQITEPEDPILIGKPIANTQIYLLDNNLQPVPVGCEGEIFIGGAGVTLGYLHRDDLTDQRFIANPWFNPFAEYCSSKLYRTGDLARYRHDGNIQFLRRNDKQVKVRGFRIELGEIEARLKLATGVSQAVAVVNDDDKGDARLIGYWVQDPNQHVTTDQIRAQLKETLPYYMVPQFLVPLSAMPQTNNGKIDYKALPAPVQTNVVTKQESPGELETETQKLLGEIWSRILKVDTIRPTDNFFDLGGHSLLTMQAISEIQSSTGAELRPPEFLAGTLAQLAELVDERNGVTSQQKLEPETDNGAATPTETAPANQLSDNARVTQPVKQEPPGKNKNKSLFRSMREFWN